MAKVLIVDDQRHVLEALQLLFEMRGGLETLLAQTPEQAIEQIEQGEVGVVVHDMNFSEGTTSGEEGRQLFKQIRKLEPELPVVLMTAWASLDVAVELVKSGADDYLQKPWDDNSLLLKVQNLLRAREQKSAALPTASGPLDLCGLLFQSAAMHAVVSLAGKVAASHLPVLITGPNGSGKEKVAEIVQTNSRRKTTPFIKVNVGALPDELFTAEIFGAERGSFTGAGARRIGRFEAADGGTLFLDEVGNLSMDSQAKLLRALQSGEFERLGSNLTQTADVRVIAATNLDMAGAIARGEFREDLYYRLAVIELCVPALAQRPEDVVLLARAFVDHYQEEASIAQGKSLASVPEFSSNFAQALESHSWPGNVRELQNRMQRALLIADGRALLPEYLGLAETRASATTPPDAALSAVPIQSAVSSTANQQKPTDVPLSPLDAAERQTIEQALAAADYVVSRAAASLGVSRQALYRRMGRLGVRIKKEME